MELTVWLAMLLLFFSGGLTPGPAVMLTTSAALRYGFWPAMVSALGIAGANLIWAGLSASGAAALAVRFPLAFATLKIVGAGVVFWIAWKMATTIEPITVASRTPPRKGTLFGRGVALQLSNPSAMIYFGGILPAFFDPERSIQLQLIIVIVTVTLTEIFGLAVYAFTADGLARRFANEAFVRVFNISAAALMAGSTLFALVATW